MTATANPANLTITDWCSKVFQVQGTESYSSSVTFMKQLTVLAMSTITFLRDVFPANCYTVSKFAGMEMNVLKKCCDDELAQFLSTSLVQAFDAFDKKYLEKLVLCIYEDECKPDNLLEYYVFEYTYNAQGVSMNIHSKSKQNEPNIKCTLDDVRRQTNLLIRSCLDAMEPYPNDLPKSLDISVRLYYNDDAPEGYQAPGFLCSEGPDHIEPTVYRRVKIGSVTTPYHKLQLGAFVNDAIVSSQEAVASESTPIITSTQGLTQTNTTARTPQLQLRCTCNKYEDVRHYKPPILISCSYCGTAQHATCYGFMASDMRSIVRHCCASCHDADPTREPSDPSLALLTLKNRESLCIFRRTLAWCSELTAIGGTMLADRFRLSPHNATKLMRLLNHNEIVKTRNDDDCQIPKEINRTNLKRVMAKFFQNKELSLADRLLAETLHSQPSSQTDNLGSIPSPLTNINIPNSSIIGRVIPNPFLNKKPQTDDTLKQYKMAIMEEEDSNFELPLSGTHNPVQVKDIERKTDKRNASQVTKQSGTSASKKSRLSD